MDKVIETAKELSEAIKETPEVQEYLKLKELLEANEELKMLRHNIALLTSEGKEEEKNNLLKIYNSHPLVVNYEASRKEVSEMLKTIQTILN